METQLVSQKMIYFFYFLFFIFCPKKQTKTTLIPRLAVYRKQKAGLTLWKSLRVTSYMMFLSGPILYSGLPSLPKPYLRKIKTSIKSMSLLTEKQWETKITVKPPLWNISLLHIQQGTNHYQQWTVKSKWQHIKSYLLQKFKNFPACYTCQSLYILL